MSDILTAFWGMTINNYDETDLVMIHNGYADHMRELVHTLEEGEEGTPHIQAYLKLKRQQRLSFVKKLFPRGHFKALTSAQYIENTKRYAQKLDATARSSATHKFYDPVHTIEGLVRKVIIKAIEDYPDVEDLADARRAVERQLVIEDYSMAKVFVSATYKNMWKEFGHQMYESVFHVHRQKLEEEEQKSRVSFGDTHTHTHTGEKFSHGGGITHDGASGQDSEDEEGQHSQEQDCESEQDSQDEDDEAYGSGSEGDCESDDDSGSGDEICL
jgi:hypothetical protein